MQFSQRFVGCILEEDNKGARQNVLLYLQQLFQDAQETNWYTAKCGYKILFLEMKWGKVSWKGKVHQIEARYTQRPIHPSQSLHQG